MFTLFANLSNDNTVAVTQQLLHRLNIPFSFTGVQESVKQHPDYPSIAAVHDVLKQYKTDTIVLQIDKDKLQQVPVPFVAHLLQKPAGFVTVTNISSSNVTYLQPSSSQNQVTVSVNEFLSKWSAVALLAEKNEQSGEPDLEQNLKADRLKLYRTLLLIFGSLLLLLLTIFPISSTTLAVAAPLFLKLAGVIICSLLLWYDVDRTNPFLQKVCNSSKATNCNAVLQSSAAKLFGVISWSEIGFFYFSGTLLFLLLSKTAALAPLAWLNVLALPYTIFSVLYQWRVTKQWCPLCLAVQGLLLFEALYFMGSGYLQPFALTETATPFLLSFLLPVIMWYVVKPLLKKSKEAEEYKNRFYRIKNDSRIFEALLEKQKKVTVNPQGLGITLGNPHATNTIIKVCNPYCGPCSKAHKEIHELLKDNVNLKVQVIFNSFAEDSDPRSKPVKLFLSVSKNKERNYTEQVIDEWYSAEKKDFKMFAEKHQIGTDQSNYNEDVTKMRSWCDEMNIEATPSIFLNGYQLPDNYSVNDLKIFLS
ncbi:MAG: thioredoxin domain-containing protein [Chitinophagaceae bacterium]|nr:thioredoxin domain-containing protein [Chitinophagaceae bacterium]